MEQKLEKRLAQQSEKKKETYESPQIKVIDVELEGIIASSLKTLEDGGSAW